MDINALLSPDRPAPPASDAPSPAAAGGSSTPRKARAVRPSGSRKRATSGLSNEITRSPDRSVTSHPASHAGTPLPGHDTPAAHGVPAAASPRPGADGFRPLPPPHLPVASYPSPTASTPGGGPAGRPAPHPGLAHRHSSTPQMETLADLASMQQRHHSTRTTSSSSLRPSEPAESQRSPSLVQSHQPPPSLYRNGSSQSLADLAMAEAPAQTPPPRSFRSAALTDAESQAVTELLSYLGANSYAYDAHVQLIGLLHKGFLAHVAPPPAEDAEAAGAAAASDPQSYALLSELRQAREAMDSRFAVGEDIWIDWLADEMLLARSGEERVAVTELCQKAVQDEPASVKLWSAYADWVQSNYAACHNLQGAIQTRWTDADKELCKELFTRDMLLNILEQGIAATQWRVDESHLLWNRYVEIQRQGLARRASAGVVDHLRDMFIERLQVPHVTSTETAQIFWPFITRYEPQNWEGIMAQANATAEPARRQVSLRGEHELALQRAADARDKGALFNAYAAYLQWERRHLARGPFAVELCGATFERALLSFPTCTEWWIDYVDFIIRNHSGSSSLLPVIERATRHCPWSGDLWGKRILRSAVENKPHDEIEHTKHRATNSGLLDIGGMEELLKVLQQWCSYLRRQAFTATSTEDDQDTAEVGIVQALEDIQRAGAAMYGAEFHGDPLYRLDNVQIKFFTEARRFNDARAIYQRLAQVHKHSADFWLKYYNWELMIWSLERMSEAHRVETQENGPHLATAVVQDALSQKGLDWPEKVLTMYLNHFQQHESSEKLQTALIEAREFSKKLESRRAKEAEEAAAAAETEAAAAQYSAAAAVQGQAATGEKRKAEHVLANGERNKKVKSEEAPSSVAGYGEPSSSASAQTKRDREHNTVTVRNLPADVTELEINKFFRDVDKPLSVGILQDKESETAIATVEFASHEDVLAAKTRNGKTLNGREVRVQSGSQNTLYVANYPPEYDETAIRKLFDSYGDIISVRLPSLKYNNRRRFCYVQFLTEDMAKAAEAAMDGKMLDGQHKLVAKISNPDAKKQRTGAQAEGREIYVKNLDRDAPESDVKAFFSQYGNVVSMNLLKLVNNRRTGTGFVVFSSADEANAALTANNKPFKDRVLHVDISATNADGRKAPLDRSRKTDVIVKPATSASPEPADTNGRRGSDASMVSAAHTADEGFRTARERKIAIFNLPDTVNDARIRAAMEQYGSIMKIQLRRQDQGAIVEFVHAKDAFNVRQGVDVSTLGPDVTTADVADLLAKARKPAHEGVSATGPAKRLIEPPTISRPSHRGGRRGGLGVKRGTGLLGARTHGPGPAADGSDRATSNGTTGAKSNADFRAMVDGSKTPTKPAAADGDA